MDTQNPILNEIIKMYRQFKGCRAIALIGSHARGDARALSGIDLMCAFFSLPDCMSREKLLQKNVDPKTKIKCEEHPIMMDRFVKGGRRITTWYVTLDLICERVAIVDKLRRLDNSMLISALQECKILWDPTRQLQAWKTRIDPLPDPYIQAVMPMIFSEITLCILDLSKRIDSKSNFYFYHELVDALEDIYELLFMLNGHYLTVAPRMDRILSRFKLIPESFSDNVQEILEAQDLRKKWRLLAELTQTIGELIENYTQVDLSRGWDQLRERATFIKNE